MFNKKSCQNCRKKISSQSNFCPHCGIQIKQNSKKEDYGILGKNDSIEEQNPLEEMFSGIGGGMMSKLMNSAMKMVEKEMSKNMKSQNQNNPNSNFELFINGKRIDPNKIKVTQKQAPKQEIKKPKKRILPSFSEDKRKKFQSLEREEPKINMKRFSEKVIYEIEIPGIKSLEDISILKLENSVEVKAIAKKAYSKILQVGLPLLGYSIAKNNLILEFKS